MKKIEAAALGGTLFVPATHKHLEAIASGEKFPRLRSAVFDTEDGISEAELDDALRQIEALLPRLQPGGPLRFVRPRNPQVLSRLFKMRGIEGVDGFVLPKFGPENARSYLEQIGTHRFMPSIEGKALFDAAGLAQLRDLLLPYQEQIILIRFGAEDLLRQLGLRREPDRSLYDLCGPSQAIGNVITAFKPYGFDIAAPVYRFFKDVEGFESELRRDLAEGLISKTIIHPDQIEPVERCYRVSEAQYQEAQRLLREAAAVYAEAGAMAERTTQTPWARNLAVRAVLYGRL